ncbi:LamG domain-containing protein [Nocardioides sp. MAHUQ-72]|uniref:LamG domain-containing protein n=1 Tax=unclassified Nocardioides TaxID=2615069 RepID=UPI00360FC9EF
MNRLTRGIVGPAAVVLALLVQGAASAEVVADWQMNEGSKPTAMSDSSGNGLNGNIGDKVMVGIDLGGGNRAYNFPGPSFGYDPGRLVTVPDSSKLDPGTGAYAVTIRFKTAASEPNIVQKGQSGQSGGYWKLVLHSGWPRCHFRDGAGHTKAIGFVDGPTSLKANDNTWHVVRCERTSTGVRITMDPGQPDSATKFIRGTIGNIDNKRPFSIGGKVDCASADVGCDYFRGQIDWVRVERP